MFAEHWRANEQHVCLCTARAQCHQDVGDGWAQQGAPPLLTADKLQPERMDPFRFRAAQLPTQAVVRLRRCPMPFLKNGCGSALGASDKQSVFQLTGLCQPFPGATTALGCCHFFAQAHVSYWWPTGHCLHPSSYLRTWAFEGTVVPCVRPVDADLWALVISVLIFSKVVFHCRDLVSS